MLKVVNAERFQATGAEIFLAIVVGAESIRTHQGATLCLSLSFLIGR